MDDAVDGGTDFDDGVPLEGLSGDYFPDGGSFDLCGGLDLSELDDDLDNAMDSPLDVSNETAEFDSGAEPSSWDDGHESVVDSPSYGSPGLSDQIEESWQELDVDEQIERDDFSSWEANLGEELEIGAEIEAFEEIIDGINPNYDPFSDGPYNTNCGSCALALEARLSGADPTAIAGPVNVGTVEEMNRITGMEQTPMSPEGIQSYAEAKGAGYHAIVGFDVPGGDGHWFNVAVSESGRAYALDSQCGVVMPFGEYVKAYAGDGVNFDISIRRG